ncbi:hypothetical protein KQX54_000656 [Cotesia glomerata]|uniref:Uncharacterized protein n=1 Tax=Cotesia glomerata TaxID=32391 RepID=A0AAV7IPT0_COTGL|nr:hypothetical protein KQX54_000656 [Cotesia glomerata]
MGVHFWRKLNPVVVSNDIRNVIVIEVIILTVIVFVIMWIVFKLCKKPSIGSGVTREIFCDCSQLFYSPGICNDWPLKPRVDHVMSQWCLQGFYPFIGTIVDTNKLL